MHQKLTTKKCNTQITYLERENSKASAISNAIGNTAVFNTVYLEIRMKRDVCY